MKQLQLGDKVTLHGLPGIITAVALADNDDLYYVVRDGQLRSHHAYPNELVAA